MIFWILVLGLGLDKNRMKTIDVLIGKVLVDFTDDIQNFSFLLFLFLLLFLGNQKID